METILPFAIWASIILIGLGLLAITIFSLVGLARGKADPLTIGIMAVPVVLFVALGLLMGWTLGAMWTVLIMFALALLALLLTGVRSLFV